MPDDAQKAEELLQQGGQKLHEAEAPEQSAETDDDSPDLQTAIKEAYAKIDAGDTHENLTVRDENLAALIHGLDDAGELGAIASEANEELDREDDASDTAAGVLKALIRVGLNEVRPDAMETAVEARKEYQLEQTDEF